jgi:proline iminopeptidase
MGRGFDPSRYRIVLYDQRGCGRATPHASRPETSLEVNTTEHLVRDLEALREHLGIDRWLLAGGSWGSALALAYAERHPARVSAIVLSTVTTFSPAEASWLYGGVARFFPEAWARFRGHVLAPGAVGDVVEAYAGRLAEADEGVRLAAARAWCAWEDTVLSLEPGAREHALSALPADAMLAFVRICTHYLRHGAWLEEGQLIREAGRLVGIPGVLIHGRRDLSCPVDTAYALARAWPDAELVVLDDAGHLGSDSKRAALVRALDALARR